jgi:hypothetical protein
MKRRNLILLVCLLLAGFNVLHGQDEPTTLTAWHWGGIDDNNQQDDLLG